MTFFYCAAAITLFSSTFLSDIAIFSYTVLENKNGFCKTYLIFSLRYFLSISFNSTPFKSTCPLWYSKNLTRILQIVDLPLPVLPTSATVCPGLILNETSLSRFLSSSSNLKLTWLNSISP